MSTQTVCDQCGATIPVRGPYYSVEKITPEWEDHEDTDLCSLACLAAWATAQGLLPECQFATKDLGPEPADRAGMRPADLNNPDDVRAITQTVPADVWAETVAKMD